MDKPRIGFIGIGVMGRPMAARLAAAGYPLTLFDRRIEQARSVADHCPGVVVAESLRAVARAADIILTMLPNGNVVREAAFGTDGFAHELAAGTLLLDCSSAEPWLTRQTAAELAARDIAMVDAPVSGAEAGARDATLVFMCGGDERSIERVRPLLRLMGRKIFHLGPVGAGHTMKCINNLVTALTFMATGEGLILGKRCGLDPAMMTDVLNASTGASWISATHIRQRILNRAFDDPFKLALMAKDIGIAHRLATDAQLPLALSAQGRALWNEAAASAADDASVSEMIRWLESIAGVTLTPGAPHAANDD